MQFTSCWQGSALNVQNSITTADVQFYASAVVSLIAIDVLSRKRFYAVQKFAKFAYIQAFTTNAFPFYHGRTTALLSSSVCFSSSTIS
jgi:hypothetical protein